MTSTRKDSSIAVYGAEIMLKQLLAMQAEAEGVLQAVDIEYIHRMRVASRRLRAAQGLFDDCLPKRHVDDWEKLIRRVTRSLGQARDLDIQLETLQRFRLMVMDPRCQIGASRLYLRLLQSRSAAQKQVEEAVRKFTTAGVLAYIQPRLQKLVDEKVDGAEYSTGLYALADESIRQRLDEFLAYEEYIIQPEKISELHAMRIAAKHLRYTIEIFDPLYPDGLKQWLKPLKDIQEVLGLIHDCDVWAGFLPGFIEDERRLTMAYFGHLRGFRRILPGLEVFAQNRASDRGRHYRDFLTLWRSSKKKRLWDKLRELTIASVAVRAVAADNNPAEESAPVELSEAVPAEIILNETEAPLPETILQGTEEQSSEDRGDQ
jgi:CHAD domain-containing protein